ncbi:hypothetical protein IKF28_02725 [Candidatus Saccharibacteria bacterium]|nr:hypothetical protein [Candidatus Saccharibacteria bacterium]
MLLEDYPRETVIQKQVLKHLKSCGYRPVDVKELWEHGVDIKVRHEKYSRYWLVEVKGGSSSKNAKSVETNSFVFGLGQIVTRVQSRTDPKATTGSNKYGVAYPYDFIRFLERKRLHWNLCRNLNLYIFLVKENGDIEQYDWRRIKREFY